MKKLLTVISFTLLALMFTGCILYPVNTRTYKHNITFYNNTNYYISDWYVKDSDNYNHTKSLDSVPVSSYNSSTLYDLNEDYYTVYFSYTRDPDYNDYYRSNKFYLDCDIEYRLYEHCINYRSVSEAENQESVPQLYLKDSNGNIYPLEKISE